MALASYAGWGLAELLDLSAEELDQWLAAAEQHQKLSSESISEKGE